MQQPHRAMASSPSLQHVGDIKDTARGSRRNLDLPWQEEAYALQHEVGEAGFVMHLSANKMSLCDFPIREVLDDGTEAETLDPRPHRVMRCLTGPRGGVKEIKRRLGFAANVAGEWYLLGTDVTDGITHYGLLWEVLSVREIRIDSTGKVARSKDGGPFVELDDSCYLARGWFPDGSYSDRADSQMRRALSTAREVAIHGQVIMASSDSKVSAGILFIPEELDFADPSLDLSEDEAFEAFTDLLLKHLSAPKKDRSSTAAYVPLALTGKAEFGKDIRLIDLGRALDPVIVDLRDKALVRMAKMLDVPPEMVDGKSGLSGLGGGNVAVSIDNDFISNHIEPLGEMIADFLTMAYLRPMLEEFEGMTPDEAARYKLIFDPNALVASENGEATARALHAMDLLSDEETVKASGHDVADMPGPEELRVRRALRLIEKNPQTLAAALLPTIPGFEHVDVSKIQAPKPLFATDDQPVPLPQDAGALILQITTAADAALERAVERAAARVVSAAPKDGRFAKGDRLDLFTSVSPAELAGWGVTAGDLFGDAWDRFAPRVRTWVREYAVTGGMTATTADDTAALVVGEVCERLTDWALGNLHRGFTVGGNGFRLPTEIVEDALRLMAAAVVR